MRQNDVLLYGGLAVGAYLLLSKSAYAGTLPVSPRIPVLPVSPSGGAKTTPTSVGGSGGGSGLPFPTGGSGGGSPGGSYGGPVDTGSYFTCSDGTLVNDASLCPVDTGGYVTCEDGTLVNDPALCPPSQPVYDSGDPCDPNSMSYDPSQCGYNPGGSTYDSGDPCDPNSAAFDPCTCYPGSCGGGGGGNGLTDPGWMD